MLMAWSSLFVVKFASALEKDINLHKQQATTTCIWIYIIYSI